MNGLAGAGKYKSPLDPSLYRQIPQRLHKYAAMAYKAIYEKGLNEGPYFKWSYQGQDYRIIKLSSILTGEQLDEGDRKPIFVIRPTSRVLPSWDAVNVSQIDQLALSESHGQGGLHIVCSQSAQHATDIAALCFYHTVKKRGGLGIIIGSDCPYKISGDVGLSGAIYQIRVSEETPIDMSKKALSLGADHIVYFLSLQSDVIPHAVEAAASGATVILSGRALNTSASIRLLLTHGGPLILDTLKSLTFTSSETASGNGDYKLEHFSGQAAQDLCRPLYGEIA